MLREILRCAQNDKECVFGFWRSLRRKERAATAEPVALQFRAERGKDAPLRPLRVHLSSARRGKDEERERQISDAKTEYNYLSVTA